MSRHSKIKYYVEVDYDEDVDIDEGRGDFLLKLQALIQGDGGLAGWDGIGVTSKITVDCLTEGAKYVMDLAKEPFEFVEVA